MASPAASSTVRAHRSSSRWILVAGSEATAMSVASSFAAAASRAGVDSVSASSRAFDIESAPPSSAAWMTSSRARRSSTFANWAASPRDTPSSADSTARSVMLRWRSSRMRSASSCVMKRSEVHEIDWSYIPCKNSIEHTFECLAKFSRSRVLVTSPGRVSGPFADEIVADAFVIAWRKWASRPAESQLPAWMFGIARNP